MFPLSFFCIIIYRCLVRIHAETRKEGVEVAREGSPVCRASRTRNRTLFNGLYIDQRACSNNRQKRYIGDVIW